MNAQAKLSLLGYSVICSSRFKGGFIMPLTRLLIKRTFTLRQRSVFLFIIECRSLLCQPLYTQMKIEKYDDDE